MLIYIIMSGFVFLYSVRACVVFYAGLFGFLLLFTILSILFSKERERKGTELGGVRGSREDL